MNVSALEAAVAPLDVVRRGALQWATRSASLTRVLARRDSRVALVATVQLAILFALSVTAPVALFAVAPVGLGVAHVASDVRYLVLRQRLPRVLLALSACAVAALVVLSVLSMLHVSRGAIETGQLAVGAAWIVLGLGYGAARQNGSVRRASVVAVCVAALAALSLRHPQTATLVFFHAHNVIAIAVWLLLFRRDRRWALAPIAVILIGLAVILSGTLLPWTFHAHGMHAFGLGLSQLASWLAPGLPRKLAASLVIAFVFLQGAHYATWLGWVPQDALAGEGTLTFRMTVRSLRTDFGRAGLVITLLAAGAILVTALFHLHAARNWYLSLSNFHGWMECALLGYFVVQGRDVRLGPLERA